LLLYKDSEIMLIWEENGPLAESYRMTGYRR